MAQQLHKSMLPRCRELREQAGLSISKLANAADVSRDLIRSLEAGNPHTRYKVMAVFNALQPRLGGSLRTDDELVPHRQPENNNLTTKGGNSDRTSDTTGRDN